MKTDAATEYAGLTAEGYRVQAACNLALRIPDWRAQRFLDYFDCRYKDDPFGPPTDIEAALWKELLETTVSKDQQVASLTSDIWKLAEALNKSVWRHRDEHPFDPYCRICGAGKKWALEHGHQPECPLSLPSVQQALESKPGAR